MNLNGKLVEQEEFRIALILSWSHMVLAEQHGEDCQFPRVHIRKWARTAEQLCQTLQGKWGMQAILIDLLPKSQKLPSCAVIEVRYCEGEYALDGFAPVSVDDIAERELTAVERLTLRSMIAGDTQGRGPFSKLGWIEEAQEWIRKSVATHRVEFNGNIRQLSAGGVFALVRFGTFHGPAFWLKATSGPNVHEFTVTQAVARYCSQFSPPFIASRKDWNAWVTEEVGQPLHDAFSLYALRESTRCLANMQISSAAHVEELLACGCFNQRMPVLRSHLSALMRYLGEAMASQISTKALLLSVGRLQELGDLLKEGCSAMDCIGIPDTLIHNDMNPDNILFDGTRVVVTDWSEAGIGCPFLTFQHLRVQASEADETHTWAPQLTDLYKEHWRNVLSESQIVRALALCPPLAIASYLCGRDVSFASPHRTNDLVLSYARSLARHMDRFAQSPEFLEALCR